MSRVRWWTVAVLMMPVLAFAQHSHAPYAGQEKRAIKALSEEEVQALLNGQGMGLAKAAELNHYPGARHVLDLSTALQLSEMQHAETQRIYDRMHQEAVRLGALIVDKERELEHLFATATVSSDNLHSLTKRIAQLQGDLRLVHLQAHVEMQRLLTREQINQYDELRGYTSSASPPPHPGHHRRHH
jgi:Spy/CpxP family protein refolding chaperone